MKINRLPKPGIIQAVLQALNEKTQNTKIGTTIYTTSAQKNLPHSPNGFV